MRLLPGLRPADPAGSLYRSPGPCSWIWGRGRGKGNGKGYGGKWNGMGGKGTEGKGEERGMEIGGVCFRGSLALGGIDAPEDRH